ncbi:MAG: 16S rRNA (guanine(966)-N(2))-methyltransferase RsmD [Bacilli bacterium]
MIRIVSGKYRHLVLKQPNVNSTRPTMDKVREALMSSLGFYIQDKVVLDLFAGSGALGIEALSRGAKRCVFVDNNFEAVKTIKENIKSLRIEEETEVIKCEYMSYLQNSNEKFSLVFLDPPYKEKDSYEKVISYLLNEQRLTEDGIIVLESDVPFDDDSRFRKTKHYRYGMVHITVLWR